MVWGVWQERGVVHHIMSTVKEEEKEEKEEEGEEEGEEKRKGVLVLSRISPLSSVQDSSP